MEGRRDVANPPNLGPVSFLSCTLKRWVPPDGRRNVANLPTCHPVLILRPAVKRWQPPPPPPDGTRDVANLPSCRPLLFLFCTLKCWGTPRWEGCCSQCAILWTTSDFVPHFEGLGTP